MNATCGFHHAFPPPSLHSPGPPYPILPPPPDSSSSSSSEHLFLFDVIDGRWDRDLKAPEAQSSDKIERRREFDLSPTSRLLLVLSEGIGGGGVAQWVETVSVKQYTICAVQYQINSYQFMDIPLSLFHELRRE